MCNVATRVGAVVHRHLGLGVEDGVDVAVVGLVVLALDGVGGDVVDGREGRRHGVLRAQRVARAQVRLGAASLEREHEVGRLCGHVQAAAHTDALQRLLPAEPLADQLDDRHLASGPLNQLHALFREGRVLHVAELAFYMHSFRSPLRLCIEITTPQPHRAGRGRLCSLSRRRAGREERGARAFSPLAALLYPPTSPSPAEPGEGTTARAFYSPTSVGRSAWIHVGVPCSTL